MISSLKVVTIKKIYMPPGVVVVKSLKRIVTREKNRKRKKKTPRLNIHPFVPVIRWSRAGGVLPPKLHAISITEMKAKQGEACALAALDLARVPCRPVRDSSGAPPNTTQHRDVAF
jgi:hypothetical protein